MWVPAVSRERANASIGPAGLFPEDDLTPFQVIDARSENPYSQGGHRWDSNLQPFG
jgi:hypothetical protein